MAHTIRTTNEPNRVITVDDREFADLKGQNLVLSEETDEPTPAATQPAKPSTTSK
jgi:hypothetical protein